MDIVKAFSSNNLHTEITIMGTYEKPLFRASDIAIILDIKQIRSTIRDFTSDEKVVQIMHTTGGPQEVTFLTTHGLYNILFKSRKPIAVDFRKWVCKIIDEIVLNGRYELEKQIEEKNNEIKNNEINYIQDLKLNRHNILIEKFKKNRCVYVAEIEENKLIKIGSSKDVNNRYKKLDKLFGNFIFLEVFDCDNFREVEEQIFADITIKSNLYNEPINNHKSQEVVKLSSKFNYDQLINIVKTYTQKILFLTPTQLLEKQKLDFENKKLEFEMISKLLDNKDYIDTVKEIIKKSDISLNFDTLEKNIVSNEFINEILPRESLPRETQIPNFNLELDTTIKGRKSKGRKVQKIDADNLQKIIKVYDSMIYVLRCPDNKGFQKSGIQTAIKNNRIYKNFRWNFVEADEDPNISIVEATDKYNSKPPIIDTILELNSDMTEILDSYYTKDTAAAKYKIGKLRMRNIIENNEIYNNCYYIEYNKCPKNLLDNYKQPINRIIPKHSKQIKQIHPITKEIVIFNSLSEIYIKFGIASKTILDAIENKTVCNGFIWEK